MGAGDWTDFGSWAVDRYEPPETASWLTKQSNEQSNEPRRVSKRRCQGLPATPVADSHSRLCREDTLAAASAAPVDYHHGLPFAEEWGAGRLSSSDGQRFAARTRGPGVAPLPRYFGHRRRGLQIYSWTSDQYSQYASKVVTATVRDATHTLDGILDITPYWDELLRLAASLRHGWAPASLLHPGLACRPGAPRPRRSPAQQRRAAARAPPGDLLRQRRPRPTAHA
ncbi:MAG TPA: Tn3 family transposase [Solirubrobacteraceae bacterium]|nr:Tn3 family transposase [Solirubrobacteraceae bacterium]